jgi:triacylglycerol esterase/lipase EstA (alpha/beta hydrolase family)
MKVLLIHGLSRTPFSLLTLDRRLQEAGWATEHFGYAAVLENYDRIVERLRTRLQTISDQTPYAIVAHSLGGLLTRSALGQARCALPQHIVMLGTPNRQPRLAAFANQFLPFQWWTGQCGANLADQAFYDQLPHLESPYTIVAGTSGFRGAWSPFGEDVNDGIVALNETHLSHRDRIIPLPVNHTFMMYDRTVQETIVQTFVQSLRSGIV